MTRHQINPAKHPPEALYEQACRHAAALKKPVYLYQSAEGWALADKIQQVPPGSLITEIAGNPDDGEAWNTGGC